MKLNKQKLSNGVKKKKQFLIYGPKADTSHRYRAGMYSGKSIDGILESSSQQSSFHPVGNQRFSFGTCFGNLLKGGLIVLISVLAVYAVVEAGSLTPSASPAATMKSLEDIWNRISGSDDTSGISADEDGDIVERLEFIQQNLSGYAYGSSNAGDVVTTAGGTYNATKLFASTTKSGISFGVGLTGAYPSSTYPLPSADSTTDLAASGSNISSSNGSVEWWQSDGTRQTVTLDFPTISNLCDTDTSNNSTGTLSVTAASIAASTTYCGVVGTLLGNLWNGSLTAGGFDGGSQANGGVDDYNNGGSAASGRYEKGWTACNSGNSYCETGLATADARDDSTGLVWSLPCNGSGCASFSDSSTMTYTWNNSGGNNNSKTASQLCSAGSHGESGWSLPHQKQLMQAYIDGSYGNLEAAGVDRSHWSATTLSNNTSYAWRPNLSTGNVTNSAKTSTNYIRCVR